MTTKEDVEQILSDYWSGAQDWKKTIRELGCLGYNIRYNPHRCAGCKGELTNEPTIGMVIATKRPETWQAKTASRLYSNGTFNSTDRLCNRCFRLNAIWRQTR